MDAMVIVFIVFMSFVSIMCLFAMLVVIRDLILSGREKKEPAQSIQPQVVPEPVTEPELPAQAEPAEKEPEPVTEQLMTEVATDEAAVTFAASNRKTLSEAYDELSKKFKNFYDEVAKHAEEAPGVSRHIKNDSYEEWKINSSRLIRLKIRRGVVIAEFNLQNREMKEHIAESRIDVKQSMTVVKLEDRTAVQFVIESIDLVVKVIEEEAELKKEERAKARREREREKRRVKAEQKQAEQKAEQA